MKKYLLISLLLFAKCLLAQDITMIRSSDIPDIIIYPGGEYAGRPLAGYLNDRFDLYMEYGIQKLYTNLYSRDKDTVLLEVAILPSPPAAFGVFSVMETTCVKRNPLGSFSCLNQKEAAAARGNLFILARNKTGTQGGQALCLQLVKQVIDNNPQDNWYPPAFVQSEKAAPYTASLRYVRGPVGLSRAVPFWSGLFENLSYHMYTMNLVTPQFSGVLARITFPDQNAFSNFISASGLSSMLSDTIPVRTMEGLYRSVYRINDTKLLFLETNSPTVFVRSFVPPLPEDPWRIEE